MLFVSLEYVLDKRHTYPRICNLSQCEDTNKIKRRFIVGSGSGIFTDFQDIKLWTEPF